ncbi:MAG: hypothetical protein MI865_08610 [Proteobacteria bacterium]|nr:hypothetical protein [Pseudomonadota bacterium]
MNKQAINALLVLFTLSGLTLSATVHARMKCWTNNEGVRECGDKVPPEFAQKGHEELSKGGMVRDKKERAKTKEEIEEAKRLAKLEEEEKQKEEDKKNQDRILLETFTSVEDIERARDERVTALEATIKLTQARNEKIQLDLDKRINSAAAQERSGKSPAEALLKDIESLKRQINNNNTFIDEKRAEQEVIKQAHAVDIERFKKLKGIE